MLIALSQDFRNRVWEERKLGLGGQVAQWDLASFRLSEARLRILCRDQDVLAAAAVLRKSGGNLGRLWRLTAHTEDEIEAAWKAHHDALDGFTALAASRLR